MKYLTWMDLWKAIEGNIELQSLEKAGFIRGTQKNKSMDVTFEVVIDSLEKQWNDLGQAVAQYERNGTVEALVSVKKCIADLRNVAGCLFLKIQEIEK